MRLSTVLFACVCLGFASGCGGIPDERVGSGGQACHSASGAIVTKDHFVTVSNGATLHVVEKYSPDAEHGRRRAVLMLPATLVANVQWNADVPDHPEYNGLSQAASRGYRAYTLDYEGYGQSSHPPDGKTVTAERLLDELGDLVRWIRNKNHGARIDLIGSSLGSSLAVALGGAESPVPRRFIGHVVATAMVYKSTTPLMQQVLFTPENFAMLSGIPGGYMPTEAATYGALLAGAEPAAAAYCFATIPGVYAVGPTLEGWDLPVFPAADGRAPVLQFWGDQDMLTPLADAEQFQSEYAGPHTLVVLPGGAHNPHFEPVRDQFWADTFAFLSDEDDDD